MKATKLLTFCLWLLLTACGGGGSDSPQPQPDTTPPVITLNGDSAISLFLDETYEELGASATDNIDGTVAVVISGTVDTSTLGEYTITYTATDSVGNASSVTRTVVVTLPDTTPPVITLNGESSISLFLNDAYEELGASATDYIDGTVSVVISGIVDTSTIGTYIVTYTATDSAGNDSSVVRTVAVTKPPDTTPPVITLNGDSSIRVLVNENYNELGASATDDINGTVEVTISGNVDTTTIDTYIITYTAIDSSGNTASVMRDVSVTAPRPFITTWQTNADNAITRDNQIEIATLGTGYDYQVDWGDGTVDEHVTGNIIHTYANIGTYTVTINGDFPRIYSEFPIYGDMDMVYIRSDHNKLQSIEQWGDIKWASMSQAFRGASNLVINAVDIPDLSRVKWMNHMFADAALVNSYVNDWDVSNVTNMQSMFLRASSFNQDLSSWGVSNVTNMQSMFMEASSFDHNISTWDVSNVSDMDYMFYAATAFNQNISSWNVSNVMEMNQTFRFASAFNQPLNTWNVSNITDMSYLFGEATAFNQDISSWDVSNVTHMRGMFSRALAFNQDISNWDVSNVRSMRSMFGIFLWYAEASSFNQDISNWDVSNVTDMSYMFDRALAFNQDISNWDVSNVRNMSNMFRGVIAFNQDISNWDVSSVTDMEGMFKEANAFNQDIGGWDVSSVTRMEDMFKGISLSTENYDALLSGWSGLALQSSVTFDAGNSKYSESSLPARDVLTNTYGWVITDGGVAN